MGTIFKTISTKLDLVNQHGASLCHAIGCRRHTNLIETQEGTFCGKHLKSGLLFHQTKMGHFKNLDHFKNFNVKDYIPDTLIHNVSFLKKEISDQDLECPICSETFEKLKSTPCKHSFCEKCIGEWLKKNNTCPLCRENISKLNH